MRCVYKLLVSDVVRVRCQMVYFGDYVLDYLEVDEEEGKNGRGG